MALTLMSLMAFIPHGLSDGMYLGLPNSLARSTRFRLALRRPDIALPLGLSNASDALLAAL